ncbi:ThuA domain-containing protein, partial [Bacteroidota bacterium]
LFTAVLFFPACAQDQNARISVLVFSKTEGFRHSSIPNGIKCMFELGQEHGWNVTATEDANLFKDDFLTNFDVIIFNNTTMDIFNEEQQETFKKYIKSGKGFVGIHAASDTEYDWKWYGKLLGGDAWFLTHPPNQPGTIVVESTDHPSMKYFDEMNIKTLTTWDEWYTFKNNPRSKVNVLATLDEGSIKDMGDNPDKVKMGDHPIIWYHEFEGARSFYTGKGHRPENFDELVFRNHLVGGIEWAAGKVD